VATGEGTLTAEVALAHLEFLLVDLAANVELPEDPERLVTQSRTCEGRRLG
jgi:hypothetical protein